MTFAGNQDTRIPDNNPDPYHDPDPHYNYNPDPEHALPQHPATEGDGWSGAQPGNLGRADTSDDVVTSDILITALTELDDEEEQTDTEDEDVAELLDSLPVVHAVHTGHDQELPPFLLYHGVISRANNSLSNTNIMAYNSP